MIPIRRQLLISLVLTVLLYTYLFFRTVCATSTIGIHTPHQQEIELYKMTPCQVIEETYHPSYCCKNLLTGSTHGNCYKMEEVIQSRESIRALLKGQEQHGLIQEARKECVGNLERISQGIYAFFDPIRTDYPVVIPMALTFTFIAMLVYLTSLAYAQLKGNHTDGDTVK